MTQAVGVTVNTTTLADYVTHAEKFGTGCVFETARTHLARSELLQLTHELERVDNERRRRFGEPAKRHRLTKTEKQKLVKSMIADGIPQSRIAVHLGVSRRWVERLAQSARKAQEPELSAQDNQVHAPVSFGAEKANQRVDRKAA